ncbi:hypothetical protein [Pseudomonas sp. 28 E 9]|uniref:hypothetical protein n=1 Tax=Pseudomonas sp. 28 E 9 TaxID=1844098 RepID=UPI00147C53E7|nr:hypothetical protein [Pseudomonas sp. 28 E 9]
MFFGGEIRGKPEVAIRGLQQGDRAFVLTYAQVLFVDTHVVAQAIVGGEVILGDRQLPDPRLQVGSTRIDGRAGFALQRALQSVDHLLAQVVVKSCEGVAKGLLALHQLFAQAQVFFLLIHAHLAHEGGYVFLYQLINLLFGPACIGE